MTVLDWLTFLMLIPLMLTGAFVVLVISVLGIGMMCLRHQWSKIKP